MKRILKMLLRKALNIDFYGISGDFNKDTNKFYGIYEFKGFSSNVYELIGQFELKTSNFYYIYNILRKLKNSLKNKIIKSYFYFLLIFKK